MNRTRILPLFLALGLAACAADGGQRGSGITSAEGNVASVQRDGTSGVGGIHVTVEGSDLETDTDSAGRFSVRGQFDGPTGLLFERQDDHLSARLELNAPAGGTLTLRDVHIDAQAGQARPEAAEVVFEGSVAALDCSTGRLTLVSTQRDPGDTDTYAVDLQSSSLRDRRREPRECSDLHVDDRLAVDGFFAEDGAIGSAELIIE